MLVVDANIIVEVTLERLGVEALNALGDEQLVAPWLLWSEVPAALSAMTFRAEISHELGQAALERLDSINVEPRHPENLIGEAWRTTTNLGWAKTYDAEYLALAKILECRMVTLDGPMWRRTKHLGFVVIPEELKPTPPNEDTPEKPPTTPEDRTQES